MNQAVQLIAPILRARSGTPGDATSGVVAGVLTVPLRELYALLWRAVMVEIPD
jgi:hypothetical protein